MILVALLSDTLRHRLASSAGPSTPVRAAHSPREALDLLRGLAGSGGGGVALAFDTASLSVAASDALCACARDYGAALLLITEMAASCATPLLNIAARTQVEVILSGAQRESWAIRRFIASAGSSSASSLLLTTLTPHILRLPTSSHPAFVSLFAWGPIPRTAREFFAQCGWARRSGERRLARAGLGSAKHMLAASRACRAWELGRDAACVARATANGEYDSDRTLRADFRKLVGVSPSRARQTLSAEDIVRRMGDAIVARRTVAQ